MGGGLLDEGDLDMARVTGAVKWRHLTARGVKWRQVAPSDSKWRHSRKIQAASGFFGALPRKNRRSWARGTGKREAGAAIFRADLIGRKVSGPQENGVLPTSRIASPIRSPF
jgi:hypothetical protein